MTLKPGFNWIDDLPQAARRAVLDVAVTKLYDGGAVLFQQGDQTTEFFQIVSGRIRQFILTEDGHEVLVYMYERGDVVGDSSVLDREPYPVNIATSGPTRLRVWSLASFDSLRRRHPEIDTALALQMSKRMRAFLRRIEELCTLPASARVAGRLVSLARTKGRTELRVSQADLASAVGVTRQSVNETVNLLRSLDLVSCRYGTITIRDIDGLERFKAGRSR